MEITCTSNGLAGGALAPPELAEPGEQARQLRRVPAAVQPPVAHPGGAAQGGVRRGRR